MCAASSRDAGLTNDFTQQHIADRIGVSGGPDKALPNIGAVRAGLLNVLIADENTAHQMLNILNNEPS